MFTYNSWQFVQSGTSTNKFLRTLLTTTPSSSHISDFRLQRRTDSRADKPDTFPGFDLEDVTLSPRKRRRQAYSQLIRGLLEKTRERLETISDVIKEEKQLRFHLRSDDSESAKVRDVDEEVTIFEFTDPDASDGEPLRFTLDTGSDDSSPDSTYTSSVHRKYFSSLLSAIGFNRVISSPSVTPDAAAKNQNEPDSVSAGIFATYLFNPVLDIWHAARKKINFKFNECNDDAGDAANSANDADDDTSDELQLTIVYADSDTVDANAKNDASNTTESDNFNQLLARVSAESSYSDDSKIENMPSTNNGISKFNDKNNITIDGNVNVGDANDGIAINNDTRMHNNNKRNAPASHIERAAQAFQNAFYKYSNYMPTMSASATNNATTSTHDVTATATNVHGQVLGPSSNKSKSVHNAGGDGGGDGNGLLANFLDDSRSNIQIVPSGKTDETTMTPTTATAADVDDKQQPSWKHQSLESAGILVLEMFGTVIGLTWGAFSHVQSYFNNHTNNRTMT